jgi:MerR family redox-sensitive transcriptional activator SoxR
LTAGLTIGRVAEETGVAATTLRYYEQIGLVPVPARVGGQRRYDESVLTRLEVIGLCKSAGFALDEIQVLFADDAPGRPTSRALVDRRLQLRYPPASGFLVAPSQHSKRRDFPY